LTKSIGVNRIVGKDLVELKKRSSGVPERALKIDFHTHTAEDPEEIIRHTGRELVDRAHYLNFDVVCITNHNAIFSDDYLQDYARERGVLLLSGAEICVERKHVLIVNAREEMLGARTFDDLRRLRTPECLVVAPHPYFPGFHSLFWKLRANIDVFDAIEFSWFYHSHINFNLYAARVAAEFKLPLVCTSDCHSLERFGTAYSIVEARPDVESIIESVRAGRIEVAANPLKLAELSMHGAEHVVNVTWGMLRNMLTGNGR
jgi:hypothetical protein